MRNETAAADAQEDMVTLSAPRALLDRTFAIQYSPNCPSRWLVRLPTGARLDLKPYVARPGEATKDALGFGMTFAEAARSAFKTLNGRRAA